MIFLRISWIIIIILNFEFISKLSTVLFTFYFQPWQLNAIFDFIENGFYDYIFGRLEGNDIKRIANRPQHAGRHLCKMNES
jgi:hypothetical protein